VSAPIHVRVSADALCLDELMRSVSRPAAGAIVMFCGVTREVSRLDYEAYSEMAEAGIETIVSDCVKRHGLQAAAAEHRLGEVALGEPSVAVAVSAPHRAEAFAGAREAIDRIKTEVPIWKREPAPDGGMRWVDGAPVQPGAGWSASEGVEREAAEHPSAPAAPEPG
jgi:molybdopterin synthase catalytic subunit